MKQLQGTIISAKSPQTVIVTVERKWQHPLYKKFVKRTKNYAADCHNFELAVGDGVTIEECRPLSKTKHFRVIEKHSL